METIQQFAERDGVGGSRSQQPGGKHFIGVGPRRNGELGRCKSQLHREEARRFRRSVIETKDPATSSSLRQPSSMRSFPERMASMAAFSIRRQIRTRTPSVKLRIL
jgi:hypothetical protein